MKTRIIYIALAMVLALTIAIGAGCANDEPAGVPEALPEAIPETLPPVEEDIAPPEPEIDLMADWKRVDVRGTLSVLVKRDWVRTEEDDRTKYLFYGDSELPAFAFFTDYVNGYNSENPGEFEAFFDWWLAERFGNQGLDVISQEFVEYNGIRGLEIIFNDPTDGDTVSRHCFYSLVGTTYVALTFRFELDGEGPYKDDIAFVFGSILKNNVEMTEWPALYLPEGTPVFPDGDFESYAWHEGVQVTVRNTSASALLEFYDLMQSAGWRIELYDDEHSAVDGFKDPWNFNGSMYEDGIANLSFYIIDMG